jgi:hypothetical protein
MRFFKGILCRCFPQLEQICELGNNLSTTVSLDENLIVLYSNCRLNSYIPQSEIAPANL